MKIALLSFCLLLFSFAITSCDQTEDPPVIDDPTDPSDETDIDNDDNLFDFIVKYINSQEEEPVSLKLKIDLGFMPNAESNWRIILKAIETAQKFVALDLSECTMELHGKKNFDPYVEIKSGEDKIISLTLPVVAADISGYFEINKITFNHFSNLEYIKGENIEHIGAGAFYDCVKLKKADFPVVNDITQSAFYGCKNLLEADFPLITKLEGNVFSGCIALETANLPNLEFIFDDTFNNCSSLKTANIPKAKYIGQRAFYNCKSLTEANFPLVETLGNNAFRNCESLTDVEFPYVKTINPRTFMDCKNLVTVSFAAAEKIGDEAFRNCVNLKTAAFLGNPEQKTFSPNHPLDPWRQGKGLFTEDCFVIYDYAFYGCKSLEVLDIRNAWNIYFAGGCLADIGTHLDMYLFDDDGTISYGHPPIDFFLGGGNDKGPLTLISMKIYIPKSGSMVQYHHPFPLEGGYHGIAVWVFGILGVFVDVVKLP